MKGIDTEKIYINLKQSVQILSGKIKTKNNILSKSIAKSNIIKEQIQSQNSTNLFSSKSADWSYTNFSTYINQFMTECPLISEEPEENINQNEQNQNSKIEITNKIYQLNKGINYFKLYNIIKINIELEVESKFWLFLHCEEKFNNKTVVIIISRDNYNRSFISLGTFIEKNDNNNIKYKNNNNNYINENKDYEFVEFKKQELIEENTIKEKNEKYKNIISEKNNEEIDSIFEQKITYELNIFDDGEKIICQVKLNNGQNKNEIEGDFFYPVFEYIPEDNNNENDTENINVINLNVKDNSSSFPGYKIKIGGSGEKCIINSFCNELNLKNLKYDFQNNKQSDCQCCVIV